MTKIIEALTRLQKTRQLSFYNRPEVMDVLKPIITNHEYLAQAPPSYISSLAYTTMKMKIKDEEIWFSLSDYLMKNHEEMTVRDIGQYLLALYHASKHSPITMDFSDEFTALELPIIKKFDESEKIDLISLTQILNAFGKSYIGMKNCMIFISFRLS